jgi:FkbM family methyltransferase
VNLTALGRDADYRIGYGEMGHSIYLNGLPEAPIVLDAGCRGFAFTKDVLALRPRARVIALDPDRLIWDQKIPGCEYVQAALVGDGRAFSGYVSTTAWADGGANFLAPMNSPKDKAVRKDCGWEFTRFELEEVACVNISNLMRGCGIHHWDLVKLDIEGEEFEVLENWPGPIADQISVEFHDFTGPMRHRVDAGYYETVLWPKLPWYRIEAHDWVDLNGSPTHFGHWDSLLVLR